MTYEEMRKYIADMVKSAFYGCSRLEQITGILKIASNVPLMDAFKGCAVLHTFKLSGLSSNIDLSDCARKQSDF